LQKNNLVEFKRKNIETENDYRYDIPYTLH